MNNSKKYARDNHIVIAKNGPYMVYGKIPVCIQTIVSDKEGMSWDWEAGKTFRTANEYSLCRCGKSSIMPFCDDTHERTGFDGTETDSRLPYAKRVKVFEGPTLVLSDAEDLCAFARFCDPGGKIWSLIEQTDNPEARTLVIREAMHCPSGRLVIHDRKMEQIIEEPLEPAIGIVEDPTMDCSGPLWVQGGILIESEDGHNYETRNRVTLCRCGASANKPFCDGNHATVKFKDGLLKG